jgi:hypothetical protein
MYELDYQMVITDSAGRAMIAEIPSPSCVPPGSPFGADRPRAGTIRRDVRGG